MTGAAAALGAGAAVSAPDRGGPFWLGPSYRGHRLVATLPDGYVYGRCKPPPDEGGCAPPYDVQNHASCARNPLSVDPQPRRVFRLRGGAIAASYDDGIDVGVGHYTVTVSGYTRARSGRAVHHLRRRRQAAPPEHLPAPIYPQAVMRELKRVMVARERLGSVAAVAHEIGLKPEAIRTRLGMARLFDPDVMAGVALPAQPWRVVKRERKIAVFARAIGRRATAERFDVSEREVRRILRRVRGLSGGC